MDLLENLGLKTLRRQSFDCLLLISCRALRLFSFGMIAHSLVPYLEVIDFREEEVGALLMLALLFDACGSLWCTTVADRLGRKNMMAAGALLRVFTGVVFILVRNLFFLTIAASVGAVSSAAMDVGPFLCIEQSAFSQVVPDTERTIVLGWANVVGSAALGLGIFCGGGLYSVVTASHITRSAAHHIVFVLYSLLSVTLAILVYRVSDAVELPKIASPERPERSSTNNNLSSPMSVLANTPASTSHSDVPQTPAPDTFLGLHESRSFVLSFACWNTLDAFASGLILSSMITNWFESRYNAVPAVLSITYLFAHVLAGLTSLASAIVAGYTGLLRALVITHVPANLMIALVPLMPNLPLALIALLIRLSISQMDVPTRQSYLLGVVDPTERTSAGGIVFVARIVGQSTSPVLAGILLAKGKSVNAPFYISVVLKLVFDIGLLVCFQDVKPVEETCISSARLSPLGLYPRQLDYERTPLQQADQGSIA